VRCFLDGVHQRPAPPAFPLVDLDGFAQHVPQGRAEIAWVFWTALIFRDEDIREFRQLDREALAVPTRIIRELVVSDQQGPLLSLRKDR
jgi:hypothetical protein